MDNLGSSPGDMPFLLWLYLLEGKGVGNVVDVVDVVDVVNVDDVIDVLLIMENDKTL